MVVGGEGGDLFFGNVVGFVQGFGVVQIDLCVVEGCLVGVDVGGVGGDQVVLLYQFVVCLGQFCFVGGQCGLGVFDGEFEVGVFQVYQQLFFVYVLVVVYQDFFDLCVQLVGYLCDFVLDVGVVGVFYVVVDELLVQEEGQGDQVDGYQEDGQVMFELGGYGWSVLLVKFG